MLITSSSVETEHLALLSPDHRQGAKAMEPPSVELNRLPSGYDGVDNVWGEIAKPRFPGERVLLLPGY